MEKYYIKYLKYKSKYFKLKMSNNQNQSSDLNNSTINEQYIAELKKIYPECKYDGPNVKDTDKYRENGYITTYGEMNYPAIEIFNDKFNPSNSLEYFIDFGSGRGKLPLFMAVKVKKSIGIELVTERHNDALELKNNLSQKFPELTEKVELINGDMFEYLKSIDKSSFTGPVLIWISNLCFPEEITKKLFDELSEKMPSCSIIGSSKIPSIIPTNIEPLIINENSNKIIVQMSWTSESTIYVYKIK
jgi:hypothetical protein